MKKLSILCLIMALIVATCSFSAVVFAAEGTTQQSTNPGIFKNSKGITLTASTDGFYYTNDAEFTYVDNSGSATATKYYSAVVTKEQAKTLTGAEVAALANKVENGIATFTKENNAGTYIAFTNQTADGNYTKTKVVCYDTVAPVIDNAKLTEWLTSDANDHEWYKATIPASKDLALPTEWLKNATILSEATALTDTADANNSSLLTVKVLYCNPNSYFHSSEKWDEADNDVSATTYGVWHFRYVIVDKAGNESVQSDAITRTVVHPGTNPQIELTSTQLKVQTTGIKAGTTYTIPTPTVTAVGTSASYTYQITKLVGEDYVVIYDSETGKITEGYEDFVTTAGSLVPGKNEVAGKDEDGKAVYLYKVVYNAKDNYGYTNTLTLNVLTTQPDAEMSAFDVWETVLIVIASLAAVGIVVLLFVKPKDKAEEAGRKHYGDDNQ
ncbi:MAG: hypothetical protein IKC47_00860 [Clostridia bacterium]|nr:hypothetical protein [Clostridia bacterium]